MVKKICRILHPTFKENVVDQNFTRWYTGWCCLHVEQVTLRIGCHISNFRTILFENHIKWKFIHSPCNGAWEVCCQTSRGFPNICETIASPQWILWTCSCKKHYYVWYISTVDICINIPNVIIRLIWLWARGHSDLKAFSSMGAVGM